jgi:hypothetical protein
VAAIQTMKSFDKQKEPAALIFSKAAGSKWARGYVCCTTAFFLLPSCGSLLTGYFSL